MVQNILKLKKMGWYLLNHFFWGDPIDSCYFQDALAVDFFKGTRSMLGSESAECNLIAQFYKELDFFLNTQNGALSKAVLLPDNIERFDASSLYTNIADSNKYLDRINKIFLDHKGLFLEVFIDGSIGSNDYKPGWSDVDIFLILSRDSVTNPEKLLVVRECVEEVHKCMYLYSILQLHGVFFVTEIDMLYHFPVHYPQVCRQEGRFVVPLKKEFAFYESDSGIASFDYFLNDIVGRTRLLLQHEKKSIIDKVEIIHRIYSFPFAFLQCVDGPVYKRCSFELLKRRYNEVFVGICEMYDELNSWYLKWPAVISKTLDKRGRMHAVDLRDVNRRFLEKEDDIAGRINLFFENHFNSYVDQFQQYLDAAEKIILGKKCCEISK